MMGAKVPARARRHDDRGRGRDRLPLLHDAGPLFAAMLELALAARTDPELAALVEPIDRQVSRELHEHAASLFGDDAAARPDLDLRLRHALSAIRGLALLRLLGRPPASDRQWRFTRGELVRLLSGAA